MNNFKQFLVYASVGVVGTAGHYVTLVSLVQVSGVNPVYATTLGFVIGALINYFLNYRITFRSQKRHVETLPKFFVVAGTGGTVNSLFMLVALKYLSIHYMLIQFTATGLVLVINFLLNKTWTFSHK